MTWQTFSHISNAVDSIVRLVFCLLFTVCSCELSELVERIVAYHPVIMCQFSHDITSFIVAFERRCKANAQMLRNMYGYMCFLHPHLRRRFVCRARMWKKKHIYNRIGKLTAKVFSLYARHSCASHTWCFQLYVCVPRARASSSTPSQRSISFNFRSKIGVCTRLPTAKTRPHARQKHLWHVCVLIKIKNSTASAPAR